MGNLQGTLFTVTMVMWGIPTQQQLLGSILISSSSSQRTRPDKGNQLQTTLMSLLAFAEFKN
jgi:hypothetical protein